MSCLQPAPRDKPGYYACHRRHVNNATRSQANVIILGDSIAAGLARYPEVWDLHLKPLHAINCGIGGDRAQHILWRVDNLSLPSTVSTAVILVGTNNMATDKSVDIASCVMASAVKLREKYPQLHVVVTGILPRGLHLSPLREKIRQTNVFLKSLCQKMPYATTFVEQSCSWTTDSGQLNEVLFHTDHLHLIKPGNDILARQLASVIMSLPARDTRMMTKYPVCQKLSYPPLPNDTCTYKFSPYIPSSSPVTTIPSHSFHHHRKHSRPLPPTPSLSPSLPTGCSSTPPSIPVPPSTSATPLSSPISTHNQGNGGCAYSIFISYLILFLFSCFFLLLSFCF